MVKCWETTDGASIRKELESSSICDAGAKKSRWGTQLAESDSDANQGGKVLACRHLCGRDNILSKSRYSRHVSPSTGVTFAESKP